MKKSLEGMCAELREKVPSSKEKKFSWGEPVARHPADATPSLTLNARRTVPTPKPGADLPRKSSGNIDLAKVKSDLTAELRASKNARRR